MHKVLHLSIESYSIKSIFKAFVYDKTIIWRVKIVSCAVYNLETVNLIIYIEHQNSYTFEKRNDILKNRYGLF